MPDLSIIEKLKEANSTVTQISAMSEKDRTEYISCLKETFNTFRDAVLPIVDEHCQIMSKFEFSKFSSRDLYERDIKEFISNHAQSFALQNGYSYQAAYDLILSKNQEEFPMVFYRYGYYTGSIYKLIRK